LRSSSSHIYKDDGDATTTAKTTETFSEWQQDQMLTARDELELLNLRSHPNNIVSVSPSSFLSLSPPVAAAAAAAATDGTVNCFDHSTTSLSFVVRPETWDGGYTKSGDPNEGLKGGRDSSADAARNSELSVTINRYAKDDDAASGGADGADVWRARLLLVGAAALYGTNFSLVKLLGDTMPVGISTTFRFGLAALATSPFLFGGGRSSSTTTTMTTDMSNSDTSKVLMLGFEVGLWNSIGYVAQAVGLETTLASKSAFICSMAVVIVPLLDYMAGKKLLPRQWVGAIMAVLGVAFLELGGADVGGMMMSSDSGGIGQLISTGDALSLVQPLVFGIGFWRMEKAMHKFPSEAARLTAAQLLAVFFSSVTYALWTLTDGGDFNTLPTALAAVPWMDWLADPAILFSIFWTGCITTALTIYMETMALETLSAAETTLIFSTEPIWGTAFAAVVMGEQLGVNAAFGAAFILSACLYSNLGLDGFKKMVTGGRNVGLSGKLPSRIPSWLTSTLAGGLATWNVASKNLPTQEINDVVDDLMETFSDKFP
jgi:drug/metabolite transporter (DMT)-like permease